MTTRTVKDILETYGLGDRSEEVVELIHDATSKDVKRHVAAPAIIVHVIHENTDNTWNEICMELGVDANKLLSHRKVLIGTGILDDAIRKPSDMCRGHVKEFLKAVENAHSDEIYSGVKPSNWVAAATFINDHIFFRDTPLEEVADQFGVDSQRLGKFVEKLVSYPEMDRSYATEDIDGDMGTLLARRRHSKGSLRVSLSDTTKAVESRLSALESNPDYILKSEDFYGKTFFWTEEP